MHPDFTFMIDFLFTHLTLHENHVQSIFRKGISAILVIHCPDVTGNGSSHSSISIPIPTKGKQGTLQVKESGKNEYWFYQELIKK